MTSRHRVRDMLRQIWRRGSQAPQARAGAPTEGEPAPGTAPEDLSAILSRQTRTEHIDLTDGWLHRFFEAHGITNHVVDSAEPAKFEAKQPTKSKD